MLVCALSDTGCLVPQTIDPIVTEPHPPPQFLVAEMPTYLAAPQLQLFTRGTQDGACHCELEIPPLFIYEADPTIDLNVRWFVDYDLSVARSTAPVRAETLTGTFNDATATRRQTTRFDFDAAALAITSTGPHVLEVFVGESTGFNDSPSAQQPNRTMLEGFVPAVYRFFINVTVEPVVPSCAQNGLPSIRVCP